MKKQFITSILVAAFIMSVSTVGAAGFRTTKGFDEAIVNGKAFDITGRYVRGELNQRIITIHLVTLTDIDGTVIKNRDLPAEDANHRALRRHSDCSTSPSTCKSQAVR